MRCNLCGSEEFRDLPGRPNAICEGCHSYERTRILGLMLRKFEALGKDTKILHFAPENGLADYIEDRIGPENYHMRDIDPSRYRRGVEKFDLCKDIESLPEEYYDIIIHNHVIEHVPCNSTVVLQRLHRALTPAGSHYFSVPIYGDRYESAFADIGDDERTRRFGQFDHVRRFGINDLDLTLGMVFALPKANDLTTQFDPKALEDAAIPREVWSGFSGHTVFRMTKGDLKS